MAELTASSASVHSCRVQLQYGLDCSAPHRIKDKVDAPYQDLNKQLQPMRAGLNARPHEHFGVHADERWL